MLLFFIVLYLITYFGGSVAARKSENKKDIIEEFDDSSSDKKFITVFLKRTKHWLLSHSQHLNFFTILLLASVGYSTHMHFYINSSSNFFNSSYHII